MNRWRGLPQRRRIWLLVRDHQRCRYCGRELDPFAPQGARNQVTIDHVIPREAGGPTQAFNLVVACPGCNERKAGRTLYQARMRLLPPPGTYHMIHRRADDLRDVATDFTERISFVASGGLR